MNISSLVVRTRPAHAPEVRAVLAGVPGVAIEAETAAGQFVVVATQGDPDAPVNKGLNYIKAYFLSKIMYGANPLKAPILRKKNGTYDMTGEFTPVSWNEAFDVMAEKWKESL